MDSIFRIDGKTAVRIESLLFAALAMGLVMGMASLVMAGTGGSMPWDSAMTRFQGNMAGPLAKGIAVIMIVVVGFMVAKGMPFDGIAGKMIGVLMGISLMMGAPQLVESLGGSGAVLPF